MGGGSVKTRFYAFVGGLALIILIVVIALSQPPQKGIDDPMATMPPATSSTVLVTIQNSIGIDRLLITNLNDGTLHKVTLIDLPFSFNCTRGNYLRLFVTIQPGYEWNDYWFTAIGKGDQRNPLTFVADGEICVGNTINIRPECLILDSAPINMTSP
jgi:hypothetical protein